MTPNDRLRNYLESSLTVKQFAKLPEDLNITEKKLTRLLNETDIWSFDNVKDLLRVLASLQLLPNITIEQFTAEYGLNDLTLTELKELNSMFTATA